MKKKMVAIGIVCVFMLSCLATVSTAENALIIDDLPKPDFIVDSIGWCYDKYEKVVHVGVIVNNTDAPTTDHVAISVNLHGFFDTQTFVIDFLYTGTGPSEPKTCSFDVSSWHNYYMILAGVDPKNFIDESDEYNNLKSVSIESAIPQSAPGVNPSNV